MTDPRESASLTSPVVPPNWHSQQEGFRIRLNSRATWTLIGVAVAAGIGFFLAVQIMGRNVQSDVLNAARPAA